MNIAIIIWELNIRGGTQRQALELARELKAMGNVVDVYCYTYDKDKTYSSLCDQLSIYAVRNPSNSSEQNSIHRTPHESARRPWLQKCKVYLNLLKHIFFVGKQLIEIKQLIESHRPLTFYDVINPHDAEVYRLARIIHHPNIVWMMNDIQRGTLFNWKGSFHQIIIAIFSRIIIKLEIKNIRTIVVLDERNEKLCFKNYGRGAVVIRSGIDITMFDTHSNKRTFFKEMYTIFASSIFFPHRRFEDLIDAVEIMIQRGYRVHTYINGIPSRSYDYYRSIQERILNKKLSSGISLIEGLSEDELKNKYIEADFFVFPNNHQTWGLVVFEAMLAGCVCIVSKGAGAHEVLTDKENALLVDPESPLQIADAMQYVIDHPFEGERISKNAAAFVKDNISWNKYAKYMLDIFSRTDQMIISNKSA